MAATHRLQQLKIWYDRVAGRARAPQARDWQFVRDVRESAHTMHALSTAALRDRIRSLRDAVLAGREALEPSIVVPAFAATCVAVERTRELKLFDVQLLAGHALATGCIAEMQTGEGKTLAAALPATLHGLGGRGVHVATVNGYLAARDYELLRPAYELLGFTVGLLREDASPAQKRAAYHCDITYATGYELGFDYLRDEVARRANADQPLGGVVLERLSGASDDTTGVVQRGQALAIVDEIDSVLIDEATTPLLLSGAIDQASRGEPYHAAHRLALSLERHVDFVIESNGSVWLTEAGARAARQKMPKQSSDLRRPWSLYVEQALRAQYTLCRGEDYVLIDDQVRIVDEFTGRIFATRSWRDGLHQAVDVKEGVPITAEKMPLARISRQQFFRLYERLCGMTGTASGHERELKTCYGLQVVQIPPRLPSQRVGLPLRYFSLADAKWEAIAKDVLRRHQQGQPVLIGTRTIRSSHRLAEKLSQASIPFQLLNGLQDEQEAELIARAGRPGAVTIATNMAGRGTDIRPHPAALAVGGLHVIVTEHHRAARIDRQLIGRSGRQGEPGSYQLFASDDDDLVRRFGAAERRDDVVANATTERRLPDGGALLRRLQKMAEDESYAMRRTLMQQELWLNEVRQVVA